MSVRRPLSAGPISPLQRMSSQESSVDSDDFIWDEVTTATIDGDGNTGRFEKDMVSRLLFSTEESSTETSYLEQNDDERSVYSDSGTMERQFIKTPLGYGAKLNSSRSQSADYRDLYEKAQDVEDVTMAQTASSTGVQIITVQAEEPEQDPDDVKYDFDGGDRGRHESRPVPDILSPDPIVSELEPDPDTSGDSAMVGDPMGATTEAAVEIDDRKPGECNDDGKGRARRRKRIFTSPPWRPGDNIPLTGVRSCSPRRQHHYHSCGDCVHGAFYHYPRRQIEQCLLAAVEGGVGVDDLMQFLKGDPGGKTIEELARTMMQLKKPTKTKERTVTTSCV